MGANMSGNQVKNITMYDVAKKAGVSKATISKVLNKKPGVSAGTRVRILKVCEDLDYRLNANIQDFIRNSVSGMTMNLAFVLVDMDFADPGYSRLIDGITKGTEENNYHLVFARLTGKERLIFDLPPILRDHRVDGILISGVLSAEHMELIRKLNIPFIILGNYSPEITRDSYAMEVDIAGSIHMLIGRLAEAGCRRVAFFDETMTSYLSKMALVSFKEALAANGMEYSDNRVFIGEGRLKGAFNQLKPIFEQKNLPFDAVCCLDYRTANGISHLIWGHKTHFGTSEVTLATSRSYAYYKLPIRAIYMDYDSREIAYQGVNLLLSNIRHGQMGRPGRTLISPIIETPGPTG
ncbi:MAG TPA: hypothetical protein DCL60_07720 [Armatimonadetes bacterium]|nr:hypothetical protein [Armatimonadota bacterium]